MTPSQSVPAAPYMPIAPLADALVTLLPSRLAQVRELEHAQDELRRTCAELEAQIARAGPRNAQRWTKMPPPPPPTRLPSDITECSEEGEVDRQSQRSHGKSKAPSVGKENEKTLRRLVKNASSFSLRHRRAASEMVGDKKPMSLRSYWSSLNFKNGNVQARTDKRRSRSGLQAALTPSDSAPWRPDEVAESTSKGKRKSGSAEEFASMSAKRTKVEA